MWHTRSRWFTSVVVGLFLALGLSAPSPAWAADVSSMFTSITISEQESPIGGRMQVDGTFTLPAGVQAGDTATITLGGPFEFVQMEFDIVDPETGEVAAHVVVSGTTATFTFTDYVEDHDRVSGDFSLYVLFERDQVTEGDTVDATFDAGRTFDDTVDVLPVDPGTPEPIRKGIQWVDPTTQTTISWTVYATTTGAVPDADRTVTIVDDPRGTMTIDCASITNPPLHIAIAPDVGGAPGTYQAVPSSQYTLTCPTASGGYELRLTDIPADYHVRVRGQATPVPGLDNYVNVARISLYGATPIVVRDGLRRFSGSGSATVEDLPPSTPPVTTPPPTTPPVTTPPTTRPPTPEPAG